MISMATTTTQRDPITFTDENIEVGVVIRIFLDTTRTWVLDVEDRATANSNLHLIDFAIKWECQPILDTVERNLKLELAPHANSAMFDLFLMSIKISKYELAGQCLKRISLWKAEDTSFEMHDRLSRDFASDHSLPLVKGESIDGASVFDLSASDTQTFLSIPPIIVCVLLRASRLAREDIRGNIPFNDKLGDHFVKIMREACK